MVKKKNIKYFTSVIYHLTAKREIKDAGGVLKTITPTTIYK